jgi:hypothetical protein
MRVDRVVLIVRLTGMIAVFMLAPCVLFAATFYVSEHGSSGNPGTKLSPFATINQASQRAQSRDTVMVLPGTYRERVVTQSSGVRFVSEQMWKATLAVHGSHPIWDNWADGITVEGFEFTGEASAGFLNHASHVKVLGNHFRHIGMGCRVPVVAAIDHGTNGIRGNETLGNYIHHIAWGCPDPPRLAMAHGIYHAYGSGRVENNLIAFVQSYGIHLWHEPWGVTVRHNTVVRSFHGVVVGGDPKRNQTARDIRVESNIFAYNRGYSMRDMGQSAGSVVFQHNVDWQNGSGIDDEPGGASFLATMTHDPKFRGGDDYRLQSDSPARDQGGASCGLAVDFAGWHRPEGAGCDLGAYEYGGPQWPAAPPSSDPSGPPVVMGPLPPPTNFRLVTK